MNVFEKMVSTQTLMFIYILVGVIMVKTRILKPEGRSSIIGLLMNITSPCMVIDSFRMDIGLEELIHAAQALAISAAFCLVGLAIGRVLWRSKPQKRRAALEYGTMISNQGYMGLPVASLVFGVEGVFYTSFFLIPIRIFIWTVGVGLYVKSGDKTDWKKLLLSPSLIATLIGLVLLLTSLKIPSTLATAIGNISSMTGPLCMFIIGASLAEFRLKDMLEADVLQLAAVRLVLIPVVGILVLRALKVDTLLWQLEAILLAMPVGSNGAIFAEMYGHDHAFAARCVFVTSILSLITVPCLTLLF